MDNRIQRILVHDVQLSPAQAEVWITVVPEQRTPTTEVRGRLMGPRCPYASTIELAYPLRPLAPNQQSPEPAGLTQRVLIPEASLWEPQCPFLYEGPIELWQDGRCCDRVMVRHGLRSLQLKERGLLVNGRPLTLQGRIVSTCSDAEALALRQVGCNLLIAAVEANTQPVWELADRLGFLMLGLVREGDSASVVSLESLSLHPSCLGWLVEATDFPFVHALPQHGFAGLSCPAPCDGLPLSLVHFLFGPAALANLGKPLLVKGEESPHPHEGHLILGNVV